MIRGRTHRVSICIGIACVLTVTLSTQRLIARSYAPPDRRSWDEVVVDFKATEATHPNDGEEDGRRLKALDRQRAVEFLLPFLSADQPQGMRIKAIGALGCPGFTEAIEPLSTIALDDAEPVKIREVALNPGLRYMDDPRAEATALKLVSHKEPKIRTAARWVVSEHGTDKGVTVLGELLAEVPASQREELIRTLYYSDHERAGRIIFEACPFKKLVSAQGSRFYARSMRKYEIREAQQHIFPLLEHDDRLVRLAALKYFGRFPHEDAVSDLVHFVENDETFGPWLYDTVRAFSNSRRISHESRARMEHLMRSGKVTKRRRGW